MTTGGEEMEYLREYRKRLHLEAKFNPRQRDFLASEIRYQRALWSGTDAALVLSAVYHTAAAMCRAAK